MAEIIELVKPLVPPGMEVTEGLVAGFLELGAVVNPLEDDLKFYKELSEKYKEFLKAAKLDGKRLDPAPGQGRLARALRLLPSRPALLRPGLLDPARGQGGEAGRRDHAREAREDDQRRVHRSRRGEGRRLPQGLRRARPVQGQAGLRSAQGRAAGHQEDGRDDEADAQEAERGGDRSEGKGPRSPGATRSSAARASSPGSRSSTRPSATSRSAASRPTPTTRRRPR